MTVKEKVKSRKEVKEILATDHEGDEVVFTNGCFDLLHVGHVRYLEEAAKFGDILVVGVNDDNSVRQLKGKKRPLVSKEERVEMLAGLEVVNYVTLFSELTAKKTISLLEPDLYVKGGDYDLKELPEREAVERCGAGIKLVPEVEGFSTTELINKIVTRYS